MNIGQIIARLPAEVLPEELADALWLASLNFFAPRTEAVRQNATAEDDLGAKSSQYESQEGDTDEEPPHEGEESVESSGARDFADDEQGTPSADLSLAEQPDSQIATRVGLPVRVPAARALPGGRAIARSLRPLRRLVASQTQEVIDEDATAENVAERHIWFPTLRPARRRWLEIALVLDDSPSMSIWRDTLREFRLLLSQVGAFRDVRVWWLDTSNSERAILRARQRDPTNPAGRAPGELLSPDGSRVVLIASDCVAPAWDSGAVARLAALWGRRQPVAILQLLPQELWRRTALDAACGVRYLYVGANEPGIPNTQFVRRAWRPRAGKQDPARVNTSESRTTDVAMPILTAEPDSLIRWARLVRRGGAPIVPAAVLPLTSIAAARPPETPANEPAPSPSAAIIKFRSVSSALAFRLAGLLAAAPLRLPVMRLVQHTLLPESRQVHLAEFFLSGLIRVSRSSNGIDPDLVDYEFLPGIRESFLDASFALDSIHVQRAVSHYVEGRFGHALDFDAILEDPDALDGSTVGAALPPFAQVTAEVLKRLGGRYAAVAARLSRASVDKAEPPPLAAPIDRPFLGKRILWVDDTYSSIEDELRELGTLGAEIEHVTTTELALEKAGARTYDAIISDVKRGKDRLAGIQLLDLLQGRNNFTPFALFTGRPSTARAQAQLRHALACSRSFADILTALTNEFRGRLNAVPRPPPHLPDQCESRLGETLQGLEITDRIRAEETAPDGSLADGAMERWRVRWAAINKRLSFAPETPIEAAEGIFASAADVEDCRFLTKAELIASRDFKTRLTKTEQETLERTLASNLPFSIPDTQSVPRRPGFPSDARSWLVIPAGPDVSSHTRWVVSLQSKLPYCFGARHIQWLCMLAESLRDLLRESASPRASDNLRSDPIDLTLRLPLPLRTAVLLRAGLRLEGLAKARSKFGSSTGLRSCRALLERTETLAYMEVSDLESAQPLLQMEDLPDATLQRAKATSDITAAELCALRLAELAHNSVLCTAGLAQPMEPSECKKALRALARHERELIEQLILKETIEGLPRTTQATVADAMRDLGPLWPEGISARRPLPVARKPGSFVMVAGQVNARGLERIAHLLGRTIAAAGFGLITGACRGIDEEVTRAFLERLRVWALEPEQWLFQFPQHDEKQARAGVGTTFLTQSAVERLGVSFERARAAVVLGGGPGTALVGAMALRTDTLLIPVAATGGAASNLYEDRLRLRQTVGSNLRGSALTLGGEHPLAVIARLPEVIRRFGYRRNLPRPEYDDIGPRSRFRSNLVAVSGLTDSQPVTGCVLARPKVIVTRIAYLDTSPTRQGPYRLEDSRGRRHLATELFRLPDQAGATVVLRVPRTLDAPGLDCGLPSTYGRQNPLSAATTSRTIHELTGARMQIRPRPLSEESSGIRSVRVLPLYMRGQLDRDWQGAPVFDELRQVRGLLTVDPDDSAQFCMVATSDWYRRVLVHFAANQLLSREVSQHTSIELERNPPKKRKSPTSSSNRGGARKKTAKKTRALGPDKTADRNTSSTRTRSSAQKKTPKRK